MDGQYQLILYLQKMVTTWWLTRKMLEEIVTLQLSPLKVKEILRAQKQQLLLQYLNIQLKLKKSEK